MATGDDQQRQYWDQHARSYDRSMRFAERRILRDTRRWACSQATGRTLEVAIGTGLNLPSYDPGVDLTGVDLSPQMLAVARQRAADLRLAVELREGSAEALDFDDDSFDTVICTLALCSIPDVSLAISEMLRVLRPGGRLVLADHVESSVPPLRRLQRAVELWSIRSAGEHFTRRPIRQLHAAGAHVSHQETLPCLSERLAGGHDRTGGRRQARRPASRTGRHTPTIRIGGSPTPRVRHGHDLATVVPRFGRHRRGTRADRCGGAT